MFRIGCTTYREMTDVLEKERSSISEEINRNRGWYKYNQYLWTTHEVF